MIRIHITPDYLNSKAQTLIVLNKEHEHLMDVIHSEITDLNVKCDDEMSHKFLEEFEKMQPQFEKFSIMIEELTKLLNMASEKHDEPSCEMLKAFL